MKTLSNKVLFYFLVSCLVSITFRTTCHGFSTSSLIDKQGAKRQNADLQKSKHHHYQQQRLYLSSLNAASASSSSGRGFGKTPKKDEKTKDSIMNDNVIEDENVEDDVIDDGSILIFELPTTRIKAAPLRFFLQIYLVGEQNTPEQGSWVVNTNTKDDSSNSLYTYYKDGTGMWAIEFTKSGKIQFRRHGQRPSLQYMLQESVMLHGVLDELTAIAFGDDDNEDDKKIDPEKRLLQFSDPNAIDVVRSKLPARKA